MGRGVGGKFKSTALVTCQYLSHKGNKYLNTNMGKQIIKMDYGLIGVLDSSIIMHFHCGLPHWTACIFDNSYVKVCLDRTSSSLQDPESPIPSCVSLQNPVYKQKNGTKRPSSEFLVATVASSPQVASCPSVPLKRSAFDYTWAQSRSRHHHPSPTTYKVSLLSLVGMASPASISGSGEPIRALRCPNKAALILFQFILLHRQKNLLLRGEDRKPTNVNESYLALCYVLFSQDFVIKWYNFGGLIN